MFVSFKSKDLIMTLETCFTKPWTAAIHIWHHSDLLAFVWSCSRVFMLAVFRRFGNERTPHTHTNTEILRYSAKLKPPLILISQHKCNIVSTLKSWNLNSVITVTMTIKNDSVFYNKIEKINFFFEF